MNQLKHIPLTESTKAYSELINDFKEILYHREIAKKQRDEYESMKTNKAMLKHSVLIDVDFKQKIVIGKGPRQVNAEYYLHQQRSLLGNVM